MLNNLGPLDLFLVVAMLFAMVTIFVQLVRKRRHTILGWITGTFAVLAVIFAIALIANSSTSYFVLMAIVASFSAVASFLAFRK
jgi:hypothetical protein